MPFRSVANAHADAPSQDSPNASSNRLRNGAFAGIAEVEKLPFDAELGKNEGERVGAVVLQCEVHRLKRMMFNGRVWLSILVLGVAGFAFGQAPSLQAPIASGELADYLSFLAREQVFFNKSYRGMSGTEFGWAYPLRAFTRVVIPSSRPVFFSVLK